MKKYEEMDSVEKKNIDDHINMTKTFLSIFSAKEFNEQTISLMKSNFEMMRIALQDMGVEFEDKNRIRELNERIRRMEDDKQSTELSYGKVASYIKTIKNDVTKAMEELGLSCSCSVSFNPDIKVEVQFFSVSLKRSSFFSKNEKEENEKNTEQKNNYNNCLNNFITEKDDEDLIIVYNEENIKKVKSTLESVLGIDCSYEEIETGTRFIKDEDKRSFLYQTPSLRKATFTFLALESSKSLSELFKSYR